jgi:phage-related protein
MGDERAEKPLVILPGEIKTPPLSHDARREIGFMIRQLQQGLNLEMPRSRPMPSIGRRCHELRVNDASQTWRVIYRTDPDAVLVVALFSKKTSKTPKQMIDQAKRLLREYDAD